MLTSEKDAADVENFFEVRSVNASYTVTDFFSYERAKTFLDLILVSNKLWIPFGQIAN